MNAIVKAEPATLHVAPSNPLVPRNLTEAMALAEMMARGKLVPEHLRNPSDCLMVIEQAGRWGMSPFAVAQATSIVKGKLMYEGKLVAAAVNTSGAISRRLDYDYSGSGATRAVKVSGILRGELKVREIELKLSDAQTENGMWKKQPDQQLAYAGARVWARRHAPEVMLGVYSPDEMDQAPQGDYIDAQASPAPAQPVLESPAPKAPPDHAAAAQRLVQRIDACGTRAELEDLTADAGVTKWRARMAAEKPELADLIDKAIQARLELVDGWDGISDDVPGVMPE